MADGTKGSKGGGSTQAPVEAADSLRSNSYFRIDDGIAEGEIGGLVNGLQSVYLNGTPIVNADGSYNFQGVTVDQRVGTQDQDYIPGFSSVESDVGVATELRSDTPWTQALENLDLSAVRITLEAEGLLKTDTSNGNVNGYYVGYAIDVSTDGGAFVTVLNSAFNGKSTSVYQKSHRIDLPKATGSGWVVRVRRTTPNANSASVSDTTKIYSYTQIIDVKLGYPNYAHIGIRGDATQFNSIPARSYDCFGRIVSVPSNYSVTDRTYTGVWDGTFKPSWTDNPAWVFYDIIVNDRFGLGNVADPSLADKWTLYQIAQYCDQLVDDGKGGHEPRFTCNVYLQTQDDAYKVLSDIASIFHGLAYWGAGQIITSADMPRDAEAIFTKANVINEEGTQPFTYESTARKTRYTCAQVTWNNPANLCQQEIEYFEDQDAIARYGVIETSFAAVGCTSQGQARRAGKWAVLSSQYETNSVTFRVGLDSLTCAPGDLIKVQDPDRAGARQGGRIKSATSTTVTLDKAPDNAAVGDTLTVVLPSGVAQQRTLSDVAGNVLTVSAPFDDVPVGQSVWMVETAEIAGQLFTVVSVTEDDNSDRITFTVSAIQHEPSKFAAIDNGNTIQVKPITKLPGTTQAPATNVTISSHIVLAQGAATNVMTIGWDAAPGAVNYKVEWQKDSGQWAQVGVVATASVDVPNVYAGTYVARVTAIGPLSTSAPALSAPTPVQGKTAPPPPPSLTATGGQLEIRFDWTWPDGVNIEDTSYTELWISETSTMADGASFTAIAYPGNSFTLTGLLPQQQRYGWVRLVDKSGNVGSWSAYASAVGGDVTDLFKPMQDQIDTLNTDVQKALDQSFPRFAGSTSDFAGDDTVYVGAWSETSQRQESDNILYSTLSLIGAATADRRAFVLDATTVQVTPGQSLAQTISSQQAQLGANTAAISSEATTRASADQVNATAIQAVQVRMPGGSGTVATEASVTAAQSTADSANGTASSALSKINASYTLTLDVNGYVSGFVAQNTGGTSNFAIVADNFQIVAPGGGQRTEYSSGNWRVYDAAGTLRVRLGVW